MGSGFDDWIYWHFFTITDNYNSSHIELPWTTSIWRISMNESLTNLLNSRMNSLLYLPRGPNVCHHVEELIVLCYSVCCHGNLVFNSLLPGNDSFIVIRCSGNLISESLLSNGRLLRLRHSGFQPSCHIIKRSTHFHMQFRPLYVVRTILNTNSNYFPTPHQLAVLCNGDERCFLWGTNWIFKYLGSYGIMLIDVRQTLA
jgi:hypothetical protein